MSDENLSTRKIMCLGAHFPRKSCPTRQDIPSAQEFIIYISVEECPTPICLVQTHCIVITQHFLILLFILDKIKTGEVCKESVNDQRSCRGRSIRQAGAPTRMHVNRIDECIENYCRFGCPCMQDLGARNIIK